VPGSLAPGLESGAVLPSRHEADGRRQRNSSTWPDRIAPGSCSACRPDLLTSTANDTRAPIVGSVLGFVAEAWRGTLTADVYC
jgi:hypothetical protein